MKQLKKSYLLKLVSQFTSYAGEAVEVEEIKGTLYVFCSELGTLRIFKKYVGAPNISQGHSTNLSKFYFSLQLSTDECLYEDVPEKESSKTFTEGQLLTSKTMLGLSATVLKRTAKTITIFVNGEEKRIKIHSNSDEGEFVFPLGQYSMAPIFRA